MSKKTMPVFLAHVLSIFGYKSLKELPQDENGNLAFSEDQEKTLQGEFPENYDALKKKVAASLAEELGADAEKEAARKSANDSLAAALAEEPKEGDAKPAETPVQKPLEENAEAAAKKITEQKQQIQAMSQQPEADEVMKKFSGSAKNVAAAALILASTATHLFGVEKTEFSRNSPWNQRAALELQGKTAGVTDFSDAGTVANLNADLKAYYTKNPEVLRDLKKDRFGLPAFWPKRFNVVNEITDAVIDVANVTQGRKPEWSPNPDFFIDAEKRRNYPVQIDVEFEGYQLQQFESAWINTLFDMDGSSPYKHSFVAYLIKKIDEQARLEDRISSINGVYVFKPKGIKAKGYFLNRQNGLRYQLWRMRDLDKKVISFKSSLGALTFANAYDYFNEFAQSLPNNVRTQTGQKIYVSQQLLNAYQAGYKLANGLHQDYKGNDLSYIEGYTNLQFVVLTDLEGSKVFFMTDENNIEILENVPNEKSIYRFEYLKRVTYVHADYYQSAAFVFGGFKLPANSPFLGQAQYVWMNDEPLFSPDFKVPMYGAPMSGTVAIDFNRIKTDINLLSDVISVSSVLTEGQIVQIEGNTAQLTNALLKKSTTPNGGNLDLASDFNPKLGGTLTLVRTATGFKELSRTSAPAPVSSTAASFTGTTIDAATGSEFKYAGTSSATLTDILNGVEGSEVKLYGQATNTLTVQNVVDKIQGLASSYVMDAPTKYIVLKKFGGVWWEIARG